MSSAYLLLATSGATINSGVTYIPAKFYKDVAVDEDTVINVWATDVMPVGKRLLFIENAPDSDTNGLFLGQVEADFNLQPCISIQQQSSEQAELVNS